MLIPSHSLVGGGVALRASWRWSLRVDNTSLARRRGRVDTRRGRTAIVCLFPASPSSPSSFGLAPPARRRTGFCITPGRSFRSIPKVGGTKTSSSRPDSRARADAHRRQRHDNRLRRPRRSSRGLVPSIVVTHPLAPSLDNPPLYRLLGGIFGRGGAGGGARAASTKSLEDVRAIERARDKRNVLYLIWREPWMTVSRDTYIARTLELARLEGTMPPRAREER